MEFSPVLIKFSTGFMEVLGLFQLCFRAVLDRF